MSGDGLSGLPLEPAVVVVDASVARWRTLAVPSPWPPVSGSPGGVLAGTTTVDATNGIAVFSDLSINRVGVSAL